MRIFIVCLFAGSCLLAFAAAADLRVASYNVRNYLEENRMADGVYRKAYPKPESEKDALRQVIRALNADVLALQEIGDIRFVRELQRDLRYDGADYPYIALSHATEDSRGLAVLSKKPFAEIKEVADLKFEYLGRESRVRRGLLEVRFGEGSQQWSLFVLHLKSKFTEYKEDEEAYLFRAREAEAIRKYILSLFPKPDEARFIIAGDFNSGPDERPIRALLHRGKLEIAKWLPAEDSRGEAWTLFYRRGLLYSRVDHMLLSSPLFALVKSSGICDLPEVLKAGDHRPIFVVLDLRNS